MMTPLTSAEPAEKLHSETCIRLSEQTREAFELLWAPSQRRTIGCID